MTTYAYCFCLCHNLPHTWRCEHTDPRIPTSPFPVSGRGSGHHLSHEMYSLSRHLLLNPVQGDRGNGVLLDLNRIGFGRGLLAPFRI